MTGGYPDASLSLQTLAAHSDAAEATVARRLDEVGYVLLPGHSPLWSAAVCFAAAVNCRDVIAAAAYLASDVRYRSEQRNRSRAGRLATVRWLATVLETLDKQDSPQLIAEVVRAGSTGSPACLTWHKGRPHQLVAFTVSERLIDEIFVRDVAADDVLDHTGVFPPEG